MSKVPLWRATCLFGRSFLVEGGGAWKLTCAPYVVGLQGGVCVVEACTIRKGPPARVSLARNFERYMTKFAPHTARNLIA